MKDTRIVQNIIANGKLFFEHILINLEQVGIDISDYQLSHLGYRTETDEEYVDTLEEIKSISAKYVENEHNGRPIAKLVLRDKLEMSVGFSVSVIELMPPKIDRHYESGFEHCGVVIGDDFARFTSSYPEIITGQQEQGPFCKPLFIRFEDGTRVKFYKHSLQDVVEMEGHLFRSL